jgi:hypothetical protein
MAQSGRIVSLSGRKLSPMRLFHDGYLTPARAAGSEGRQREQRVGATAAARSLIMGVMPPLVTV